MAYIVIQGSKGFVSLVEKQRVKQADGSSKVQTIRNICGLGVMTKEEYLKYQAWAHSFKDQEERKGMVLASGRAIITKKKAVKAIADHTQKKTTVKKVKIPVKELTDNKKELKKIRREKELREQELRIIANLTPSQRKKRLRDLIDDQKDLQVKFKKLSGRKEDIQKDNIRNPHKVEGNVKHVIFINEQQKEIRNKIRIMNKEKQLYKDSLKKFGGRW